MFPLSHIYVSTKVAGKESDLLILGSVIPDLAWFSEPLRDALHSSPAEFWDFVKDKYPDSLDLALGVKLHSQINKGADYYSDDNEIGYAKINGRKIIKKVTEVLNIEEGQQALGLSHSFIEAAIDLLLAEKNSSLPKQSRKIKVDIEQKFQTDHKMINVAGYIEGRTKSDSFVVFTAHYDHLGQMGASVYFPGANDNASGTAMMLDLAKYYSENTPDYSIAFIAFTGEEVGLLGSEYYVLHPLFPLSNIRFLVNLDLVGTGDDGIKVVNGAVIEKEFNLLTRINDEKKYLKAIEKRGEAAISDHYPFYAKGVKSFYIYTLGGISEYHNILDKAGTLPLTKYNELFRLLIDFVKTLNN